MPYGNVGGGFGGLLQNYLNRVQQGGGAQGMPPQLTQMMQQQGMPPQGRDQNGSKTRFSVYDVTDPNYRYGREQGPNVGTVDPFAALPGGGGGGPPQQQAPPQVAPGNPYQQGGPQLQPNAAGGPQSSGGPALNTGMPPQQSYAPPVQSAPPAQQGVGASDAMGGRSVLPPQAGGGPSPYAPGGSIYEQAPPNIQSAWDQGAYIGWSPGPQQPPQQGIGASDAMGGRSVLPPQQGGGPSYAPIDSLHTMGPGSLGGSAHSGRTMVGRLDPDGQVRNSMDPYPGGPQVGNNSPFPGRIPPTPDPWGGAPGFGPGTGHRPPQLPPGYGDGMPSPPSISPVGPNDEMMQREQWLRAGNMPQWAVDQGVDPAQFARGFMERNPEAQINQNWQTHQGQQGGPELDMRVPYTENPPQGTPAQGPPSRNYRPPQPQGPPRSPMSGVNTPDPNRRNIYADIPQNTNYNFGTRHDQLMRSGALRTPPRSTSPGPATSPPVRQPPRTMPPARVGGGGSYTDTRRQTMPPVREPVNLSDRANTMPPQNSVGASDEDMRRKKQQGGKPTLGGPLTKPKEPTSNSYGRS